MCFFVLFHMKEPAERLLCWVRSCSSICGAYLLWHICPHRLFLEFSYLQRILPPRAIFIQERSFIPIHSYDLSIHISSHFMSDHLFSLLAPPQRNSRLSFWISFSTSVGPLPTLRIYKWGWIEELIWSIKFFPPKRGNGKSRFAVLPLAYQRGFPMRGFSLNCP